MIFKNIPDNIFVLNNLGLIYSNLHIFNKAETYFKEALKKNPNFFFRFMDIDIPHLDPRSNYSENLGLPTRRAMTRLIRMGVPLKRQAY